MSCVNGYNGGQTVWYTTQSNRGGIETETVTVSNMASTVTLLGMEPNTNYTVQLYARNDYGRSDSSLIMEVRTGGKKFVIDGCT